MAAAWPFFAENPICAATRDRFLMASSSPRLKSSVGTSILLSRSITSRIMYGEACTSGQEYFWFSSPSFSPSRMAEG